MNRVETRARAASPKEKPEFAEFTRRPEARLYAVSLPFTGYPAIAYVSDASCTARQEGPGLHSNCRRTFSVIFLDNLVQDKYLLQLHIVFNDINACLHNVPSSGGSISPFTVGGTSNWRPRRPWTLQEVGVRESRRNTRSGRISEREAEFAGFTRRPEARLYAVSLPFTGYPAIAYVSDASCTARQQRTDRSAAVGAYR